MLRELAYLIPHLSRYWPSYAVGGLCIFGSVGLRLVIPLLVGGSFDALRRAGEDGGADIRPLVVESAGIIVAAAIVVALVRVTSRISVLGNSRRVAHDVRNVVFDRLLELAPSFYVRNPVGQVMSRSVNDVGNVQGVMGPVILYLAETLTLFAVSLALMGSISPSLTLWCLLPFPLFLWLARKLAVRIQEDSRAAQNSLAEVAAKVDESLSGQMVIKTMTLEAADAERFVEHCRAYRRINLRVTRHRALLVPLMMGLASLSTVIVLWLGVPRVTSGDLSLGGLIAITLYLQMLAAPTRTLGFVISSLRRGASAVARVRELAEAEVTLRDPEAPVAAPVGPGALEARELTVVYPPLSEQPHLEGSLPEHLREATEQDGERRVLDRVSFTLPAGRTLGVVGHVGAGKTTLVRALARQLEVDPGQVFIDGTDVTTSRLADVRRAIGVVPQDAFLFSRTLAENVALGRPDAARADIDEAAAAAQLDVDLAQLPDGLDTRVGERGFSLSGGQRQRTALARVLLLEPKILLLDDTLSAVDARTADAILARLREFAAGRTTVIVSHRLSMVQHADEILVLEDGAVAERGTHPELLEARGIYAELWRKQQRDAARARRQHELAEQLGLVPEESPPDPEAER
jgi:ATP-binding cassette subfamily B multidrug efflux pump